MTEESTESPTPKTNRRGRKPYPTVPFTEVLELSTTILNHGAANRMNRLRIFDRMDRKPNSGPSRALVSTSLRYGLTTGGNTAEYIDLTADGILIAAGNTSEPEVRKRSFEISIAKFDTFNKVYDALKGQRLPDPDVFEDTFKDAGVQEIDCPQARHVFTENARFVGLIEELSGNDRLVSIEHAMESLSLSRDSKGSDNPSPTSTIAKKPDIEEVEKQQGPIDKATRSYPSVHIDIQIHIDASATSDQIDQVFKSMGEHLYSRRG